MKKGLYIVYICIFFCLCLIPAVGMAFDKPEVVANEIAAELPSLTEEGKLNTDYPEQLTSYVDKTFGLRQEMITANGILRSLFGESGNEKVVRGKDGWLFFEETVKDYTGSRTMNDREVFCAAQNLKILEKSVEELGGTFYFTVAPNKNSLYGQYMPKRYLENHKDSNFSALAPYLEEMDAYIDLFSVFEAEEKPLYFKEDSHWNNEGALLARNTILKGIGRTGRSYENAESQWEKIHRGDLYEMAYPKSSALDEELHYDIENRFQYLYKVRDNDEPLIETFCEEGMGNLICFRDSFGTALLPFLADEYEKAWFSKETPYNFTYAGGYFPGDVVIELVERNLEQLCQMAPVIEAPSVSRVILSQATAAYAEFETEQEENWCRILCRTEHRFEIDDRCYIAAEGRNGTKVYEPFYLADNCFELRVPADEVPEGTEFSLYYR